MLTIAGSGPSCEAYGKPVTIATKKQSLPSEYVAIKNAATSSKYRITKPIMCISGDPLEHEDLWIARRDWQNYFLQFDPRPIHCCGKAHPCPRSEIQGGPKKFKASLGMLAVFMAVERFNPQTIGLIGFDWVLDENPNWLHDASAERRCILSLVNVRDLRDDTFIRRIRPA